MSCWCFPNEILLMILSYVDDTTTQRNIEEVFGSSFIIVKHKTLKHDLEEHKNYCIIKVEKYKKNFLLHTIDEMKKEEVFLATRSIMKKIGDANSYVEGSLYLFKNYKIHCVEKPRRSPVFRLSLKEYEHCFSLGLRTNEYLKRKELGTIPPMEEELIRELEEFLVIN